MVFGVMEENPKGGRRRIPTPGPDRVKVNCGRFSFEVMIVENIPLRKTCIYQTFKNEANFS